jgi:hypothetical protein
VRVEAHGAVALGAKLAHLCLEALRVKPVPACRETKQRNQHMRPSCWCLLHVSSPSSATCVAHVPTSDAASVPACQEAMWYAAYEPLMQSTAQVCSLDLRMCAHLLHTSQEAPGMQEIRVKRPVRHLLKHVVRMGAPVSQRTLRTLQRTTACSQDVSAHDIEKWRGLAAAPNASPALRIKCAQYPLMCCHDSLGFSQG